MKTPTLPVADICPDPQNVRQELDEMDVSDIIASAKVHGILQPIKVRKAKGYSVQRVGQGKNATWEVQKSAGQPNTFYISSRHKSIAAAKAALPKWEIVYGHRRHAAAKALGLKEIPAMIADLDDREALEEQIAENVERKDISPISQAEGYQRLITEHKVKPEAVAKRFGLSLSSLRSLLKLLHLIPKAAAALRRGLLTTSHATLIARLGSADAQTRATNYCLGPNGQDGAASIQELKQWIAANERVELKMAPFDTADPDVLLGKPSCEACPLRAGNLAKKDPEAWEGVRADVCTSPDCYQDKVRANVQNVLTAKRGEGCGTLEPEIGRRIVRSLLAAETGGRYVFASQFGCLHPNLDAKRPALDVFRAELSKAAWCYTADEMGRIVEMLDRDRVQEYLLERGMRLPEEGPIIKMGKGPGTAGSAEDKAQQLQRQLTLKAIKHAGMAAMYAAKKLDSFPPELLKILRAVTLASWRGAERPVREAVLWDRNALRVGNPVGQDEVEEIVQKGEITQLCILLAQLVAAEQAVGKRPTVDPSLFETTFGWSFTQERKKMENANGHANGKKEEAVHA